MEGFDYREVLGYSRNPTLRFSEFVDDFAAHPENYLHTSSTLISEAIKFFGYSIVIRSGEPVLSYRIFKDIFSSGINAVFGQETCIKHMVDAIESAGKETGPNRGLVLVGPPASGKTNIVDLLTTALEEYTKHHDVTLYSFFFEFSDPSGEHVVEVHSSFRHNPVLLFPIILQRGTETRRPRHELFEYINYQRVLRGEKKIVFPTYYQNASLDKGSMDIIENLLQNPKNRGKSLFDIIEEYVRIEAFVFSNAQACGVANVDDMRELRVRQSPVNLGPEDEALIHAHLPGSRLFQYEGAVVASNRGVLHIHDAFGSQDGDRPSEKEYKPLLMLLGSGRVSVDWTQSSIDTSTIMTTNLEEMDMLDSQLTSSKLLDRIEKIPVNYLLDANAEMDILERDMANMQEKYEVDPNLLRIAATYAVMTRLLPPERPKNQVSWDNPKRDFYASITVEQKVFIFAYHAEDPAKTITRLPLWHPFRNEMSKLGLNISSPESYLTLVERHPRSVSMVECGLFTPEQEHMLDDEFMRELWLEHYPNEGKHGLSVRQLQNIMRNTIARSDGRKVHVGTFLSQLRRMINEGPHIHHWLAIEDRYKKDRKPIASRSIGALTLGLGEGDYGDFAGLVKVVQAIYFAILKREITVSTVDRDPGEIEGDLRRYLQHVLLANALENKAFSHIMVPRFTFVDPNTGRKVDAPDPHFMGSIEKVLAPDQSGEKFRRSVAQRFVELQNSGELRLEEHRKVVNSKNDNLLQCFADLYGALLSHRRTVDGINVTQLKDAFFARQGDLNRFEEYPVEIQHLVETVLFNMMSRFQYPEGIALDTVVFAIRKNIVDFAEMIT